MSRNKESKPLQDNKNFQPRVLIVLPVFNEEKTIHKTLEYIANTEYPSTHYQVVIGSDASTDSTDVIISQFVQDRPNFIFERITERSGKPMVLNNLVKKYSRDFEILLFMDCGALIDSDAIHQLIKNFTKEKVGIVAANFKYKPDPHNTEVAKQEKIYIDRENEIKHLESLNWGSVMGVFGACYAVRKSLFKPFPKNFIVDDFYITMHVLKEGFDALHEPKALVLDYNNSTMQNEFKRKVRISIGNYQNLAEYFQLLWERGWGVGFSFLSHKVLRWLGPFFIIIMFLCSLWLGQDFYLFKLIAGAQILILLLPILDFVLKKLGINIQFLRNISYFYFMNFALLIGFFKYLGGVKSSIWTPLRN